MPVTMDENGELQPVGPTRVTTGRESDDRLTPPEVWDAVDAMIGLNRYPVYDVVPYEDDERCPDGWFGRDALNEQDWPQHSYCNPPFSQIKRFAAQCVDVAKCVPHHFRIAMLGPTDCTTEWARTLSNAGWHFNPSARRIAFLRPDGSRMGTPSFGVALWSNVRVYDPTGLFLTARSPFDSYIRPKPG